MFYFTTLFGERQWQGTMEDKVEHPIGQITHCRDLGNAPIMSFFNM